MGKLTKKLVWMMFTLVLLATLLPIHGMRVKAVTTVASGTCGAEGNEENVTWVLDSDGVLTISGSGDMADYDSADNTAPWYPQRNIIKKIVVNGITTIGNSAFLQCKETELDMSNNTVQYIHDFAFSYNEKLEDIKWSNKLKTIGYCSFDDCKVLKEVILPDTVTSLGQSCFQYCFNLSYVYIPGTITNIPPSAFCML